MASGILETKTDDSESNFIYPSDSSSDNESQSEWDIHSRDIVLKNKVACFGRELKLGILDPNNIYLQEKT
jgi:hypothetical protein